MLVSKSMGSMLKEIMEVIVVRYCISIEISLCRIIMKRWMHDSLRSCNELHGGCKLLLSPLNMQKTISLYVRRTFTLNILYFEIVNKF